MAQELRSSAGLFRQLARVLPGGIFDVELVATGWADVEVVATGWDYSVARDVAHGRCVAAQMGCGSWSDRKERSTRVCVCVSCVRVSMCVCMCACEYVRACVVAVLVSSRLDRMDVWTSGNACLGNSLESRFSVRFFLRQWHPGTLRRCPSLGSAA